MQEAKLTLPKNSQWNATTTGNLVKNKKKTYTAILIGENIMYSTVYNWLKSYILTK